MENTQDFKDIAPYEGQDFKDATARLSQYSQLMNNFTDIISRHNRFVNAVKSRKNKELLVQKFTQVDNYIDFQKQITCELFLDMIISSSIENFTTGGLEDLEDKPHIYISNHRDILLDAALVDYVLYNSDRIMGEMVIGDNLLANQFITDLFKVNGAVTVKRTASSASELKEITQHLSDYLTHCVTEKGRSVWIAQKSGRSKDGIDNTSPAIIKMLYLSSRAKGLSFNEFIKKVSIVPVAISYQFDPCDVTKSQYQIRKLKAEGCYDTFNKKKYADILDMVRGLRMYKGNVHVQFGKPLPSDIDNARDAASFLDNEIHKNYRLWDTNWFCYDYLNKSTENSDKYSETLAKAFVKKYRGYSQEVVDYLFNSYANPVRSALDAK